MRRWTLSLPVVSACVAALAAQQPLFKTSADYVRVDVVVTDKDDKPVTDLTKDEFKISEGNMPQAISDFQYVSIPVEHRTIDIKQAPAPAPDVATNTPATPNSRLFAFVVDDLTILESQIIPLKRVMTDFVSALSPNDEVAVVYVGRSDLSQNFTTDTGRIVATINNVRAALGFAIDAMAVTEASSAVRTNGGALGAGRSAAFVLKNVATSLAGSGHSRRAIVFISAGNPLNPNAPPNSGEYVDYRTMKGELDDAFDQARRADVPIYTIDPRGAVTSDAAVRGWVADEAAVQRRIRIQQDYLATVAINTGGRAFTGRSNLKGAVDELIGENGSYYLLGYSPDPAVHDGKYHPIDVKVTRPGLHVRARMGYVTASTSAATADAKPTLDKAMSAGVNVSGLSLRAFATPIAATAKGMNAIITVEVTYPAPVDGSTRIDDNLELSLVALDPDGKVKASSGRALHFTTTVNDGATSAAFLIDDAIVLPSQLLTLRIGVASQALDRAGTVQLPIDVPKPGDTKLQWGGIAIGFADFSREATLRRDALTDLVPFQPTTTRIFAASDSLRIFGRLFWGSSTPAGDVTLTIDGTGAAPPQVVHVAEAAASEGGPKHQGTVTATIPLKGLAIGSHTITLEAKLSNGQTAQRQVPFEVK